MILPDVNVLVYAYRREAAGHDRYASWLAGVVAGPEGLALAEAVLIGFLRIVTNPRIFADPAPAADATALIDVLRASPRSHRLEATDATWQHFRSLTEGDPQVRGNLIPAAWLAALARSHGCRLATADRGFARFEGLDWFDPIRA